MPVTASAPPTADPLSSRSATQHTHDHDSLSCLPCRRLDRFLCHAAGSTLSLRPGDLALIWGRRARRCLPCLAAGPCCDTLPLTPASPTSTLPPVGEPCARPLSTPYTLAYARYSSSLLSSLPAIVLRDKPLVTTTAHFKSSVYRFRCATRSFHGSRT